MTLACDILSCLFNFGKNKIYMFFQKTSSEVCTSHSGSLPPCFHREGSLRNDGGNGNETNRLYDWLNEDK